MDLGLKDRVAIVTGGNRGIGFAISAELLKEGAHVVVASLDPARNAQAIEKLKSEHKVTVHDTPKDIFPAFIKATNVVYDRESTRNPLFKEVLDSQRAFAKIVVPYWTKINGLYYQLGFDSPNRG